MISLQSGSVSATALPDPCTEVCRSFSAVNTGMDFDLCGANSSVCLNGFCTTLFWAVEGESLVCSDVEVLSVEELARPLSCAAARELLAARGVVLPTMIPSSTLPRNVEVPVVPSDHELEEAIRQSIQVAEISSRQRTQRLADLRISRECQLPPESRPDNSVYDGLTEDQIFELMCQRSVEEADKPGQEYVVDNRPGHIGFHNLGATCYLNAIMQLIAHSDRLVGYFNQLSVRVFDLPSMNSLTRNILATIHDMWFPQNGGEPITARSLFESLREFAGFGYVEDEMEDAALALGHVLDGINVATDGGFGRDMVYVPVVPDSVCRSCNRHFRNQYEPDRILRLPLPRTGVDEVDLVDCFRGFSAQHDVELVQCPLCPRRGGMAGTSYSIQGEGPQALFMQLLRFHQVGNEQVKIHTRVNYPTEFNLRDMPGAHNATGSYRLKGVIHHQGESLRGGHFVAETHHMMDGEWLMANDRDVHEIEEPEQNSRTAYIFLYERFE